MHTLFIRGTKLTSVHRAPINPVFFGTIFWLAKKLKRKFEFFTQAICFKEIIVIYGNTIEDYNDKESIK